MTFILTCFHSAGSDAVFIFLYTVVKKCRETSEMFSMEKARMRNPGGCVCKHVYACTPIYNKRNNQKIRKKKKRNVTILKVKKH